MTRAGAAIAATAAPPERVSVALICNWPLTLLCVMLLPLLLWLGCWQLQRAAQKARLQAAIEARLSAQPQPPEALSQLQAYTPVRLQGHYTGAPFYLDNRMRHGVVGYEILQVFVADKGRWLINRGWVAAGARRAQLPDIPPARGVNTINGFLYPVSMATSVDGGPGPRIQQLDSRFSDALNLRHPQWTLRLGADSATALDTGWQLVNIGPQRHRAYAAQWFAMAAVLPFLWVFAATNLRAIIIAKRRQSRCADT